MLCCCLLHIKCRCIRSGLGVGAIVVVMIVVIIVVVVVGAAVANCCCMRWSRGGQERREVTVIGTIN